MLSLYGPGIRLYEVGLQLEDTEVLSAWIGIRRKFK
jgi:hypothetical protein